VDSWWDAIVVGAGPAGSVAAHRLASAGARVAIVEARGIPRHKTCGGGVVWRTWRRLPIAPDSIERLECRRAEFELVDGGFSHSVRSDVPLVVMTRRCDLDAALVDAARKQGAAVLPHNALRALRSIDGGVEVTTAAERLRARFVVAADGASGPTRRLAGWTRPLRRIPAIEWEAIVREGATPPPARVARFFFGAGGPGYAWLFPKRGHLSVGALSTVRDGRGLRAQLEAVLRRTGVSGLRIARRHGFLIPLHGDGSLAARGRVLLTGDAAGLADPITLEGISHACASGGLAARALLDAGFRSDEAAQRYQALLEREVLSELRWARRFARILYGPPWLRRRLFALCGPELGEAMTAVIRGDTRYRELVTDARTHARLARSSLRRALAQTGS
jgi:geranylgeranyl reductase family protein